MDGCIAAGWSAGSFIPKAGSLHPPKPKMTLNDGFYGSIAYFTQTLAHVSSTIMWEKMILAPISDVWLLHSSSLIDKKPKATTTNII